jgi:hypothetical protein
MAFLNQIENRAPRSNLDQIQTTIPPLIAESSFEICKSRGLTFLGPLSISVHGTSQLDQGYPMLTMHQPIMDDKVRSLCLNHDVSWDRPATRGLQFIQVTVQLNCTLAHEGGLQATCDVIQDGIVPPCQPSLFQCVFTMDQNMEQCLLHHVPTELAFYRSTLPHLFRLVKVGNVSMLLFTANFKTPQGRSHTYDFHVMPSFSACSRAKRFPCIVYPL